MTPRQEHILELVVIDYTETGLPVSSFQLCQKYDISFSSATIRNEFAVLEDEGYLTQPHSSSGRIPTDQGFRYYVNQLRGRNHVLEQYAQVAYALMRDLQSMTEIHSKLHRLLTSMALESKSVAIGKLSSDMILAEGMQGFFDNPYFTSLEFIREALDDLEEVKTHIDEIGRQVERGRYELFIGNENPIVPMRKYSMIVGRCDIDGEDGTIIMIGPKGMRYDKNLALIEYVLNPEEYEEE